MAKPTLIDLVQDILADADGDEVNSISDTVESDQCARVVRDSFRTIVDNHDLKIHDQIDQLTATSSTTPTKMERPASLHSIELCMYDKRLTALDDPRFQEVIWMDPINFIELTAQRTSSDTEVETMTLDSGHDLLIKNDQAPTYYTQLQGYDDFIFDSYDLALETNLQASKSLVYGTIKPTLSLTDQAVIDLPEHIFILLRSDARAFFFDLYKDGVSRKVDERDRHANVRAQRMRHLTKNQQERQTGPDYGRKSNHGRRSRRDRQHHH